MIVLTNGAKIYQYGRPKKFLMSGVHGEERAGVMTLISIIKDNLKDVWVLPCLNMQGHKELNRFCNGKNLNDEFREDTTIDFMRELMEVIRNNKPDLFIDLHEDTEEDCNYIWSNFKNKMNNEVELFCKRKDYGYFCYPDSGYYKYSSESWARSIGIPSAYTTESFQYQPLQDRLKVNKGFVEFFLSM